MTMRIFTNTFKLLPILVILLVSSVVTNAQQADTVELPSEQIEVTIESQQEELPVTNVQPQGGVKVRGTISEASSGSALEGINVSVPGYSSSITDKNGSFEIMVPANASTMIVSGAGYHTKEVAVKGRSEVTVKLHEDRFNSVYRTAFLPSTQKPLSRVVNSVVSVSTPNKFQTSSETPENYFQGKVPGLNMIRRSGTPGIGTFMSLRGFNSLQATNQPLVVVDGMIYDMNDYGGSLINNYFSNPLEFIDIKDIDNITVVKDATSMYGSKGANGAIFITTGHAQDLATKIDFSIYTGMNIAPKSLPVMEASDYRIYLSDILKSAGYSDDYVQSQAYMSDDPSTPQYYKFHNNTNWQREVFENSYNQNYYIRVQGGDNIAKYSLSMGYAKHDGIVKNTDFKRYITRFNADLNISPRLSGNTNLSFTYGEHNLIEEGISDKTNPVYLGLVKAPILATNEISDEGITSPNLADIDVFNMSNPVQLLEKMVATNKNYRFFGSVNFNYKVAEYVKASSLFGITYDKIRENLFIPQRGVIPDTLYNALARSRMGAQLQRTFSVYSDTRIAYDRTYFNKHTVSARLGVRLINNRSEEDFGLGFNSATDDLQTIGTGVSTLRQVGGGLGEWVWLNYYAGIDYALYNKYFLSLNAAVDGSSRFGKEAEGGITLFNSKFGVFPSIAAGWMISSEDFMANNNLIELLKLRVSYGLTGNDDIGNYSSKQYYLSQNLLGIQGLVLGNLGNPALRWETVAKMNVGIDVALLNERLTFSADVFQHTTDDMVTYESVQSVAGLNYVVTNNGGMKNRGFEVALNGRVLDKSFKLDLGLSLASYRNEVTGLPYQNLMTSYAGATVLTTVGQPVGVFYGYETKGVYTTDEEASAFSTTLINGVLVPFRGGDVRFVDRVADGIIDEKDKTIIGDPNPDFTGMFNAHAEWREFTFDAAFTFSYGNDVYNYTRAQLESMKGYENQTLAAVNRWRTNGQVTTMPRAEWGDPMGNSRFSDRWIEDGSYLRLRTVSIAYELPFRTQHLKYSMVYLTGNNLLTFTKYLGYDAEFSASNNVLLQGIDTALVPQFRSIMLGVRVGL